MVKVKICGITSLEDALAVVCSGADAVGFVFYRRSPRYIAPQKAGRIARLLPGSVLKVGVFVNAPAPRIKSIAKTCGLDILQFHGEETPEFYREFRGFRIVKAFRIRDRLDFKAVRKYAVFGYLFDTYAESSPGGTGRSFDWKLLGNARLLKKKIFLSGGINAGNVRRAIRIVRPHWIDVSSAVESKPGKKDHRKIAEFIKKAKS